MADEGLVRMVPILTARELAPVVAFYEWLGLRVTAEFDGYVILATDPVAEVAAEVHLSEWDGHDRAAAGSVYLRVRDAQRVYERLHDDLSADGRLFHVPASGFTDALTEELDARLDRGEPVIPLSEIDVKPWGMHEFGVIDPAGWLVRVGAPAG